MGSSSAISRCDHGEAIGLAAWQPLPFKPGTQYHYSSIGYELLGLIAARLGAQPLPDLYRQRIFKPLGLRQTASTPRDRSTARTPAAT